MPLLAQMRRGTLQYCVLALLASEERYGFDLVRGLADVNGMVTSEGTIYPLLSRLRRDGLVESTWRESPTGPPRRYYRLTDAGRAGARGLQAGMEPVSRCSRHTRGRKGRHDLQRGSLVEDYLSGLEPSSATFRVRAGVS